MALMLFSSLGLAFETSSASLKIPFFIMGWKFCMDVFGLINDYQTFGFQVHLNRYKH
jgi:hypothetical protein